MQPTIMNNLLKTLTCEQVAMVMDASGYPELDIRALSFDGMNDDDKAIYTCSFYDEMDEDAGADHLVTGRVYIWLDTQDGLYKGDF